VNEVIDMHGRRVHAALRNRIPPTIFATLFAVAILVMAATGYAGGLAREESSLASILLALVLAVVMTLILDLDRPFEGLLSVSQQSMMDVLTSMGPAAPPR
jgi:Zn-dependent protease with chaperone function